MWVDKKDEEEWDVRAEDWDLRDPEDKELDELSQSEALGSRLCVNCKIGMLTYNKVIKSLDNSAWASED